MSLRPLALTLSPANLSDLFFNYEHPAWDELYEEGGQTPSSEAIEAAILEDAREFVSVLGAVVEPDDLAKALAKDFLKRV